MVKHTEIDWDALDEYWTAQYEEDYGPFSSSTSCEHMNIPIPSHIQVKVPVETS